MPSTEDIQPCNHAAGEGLGVSVDETLLEGAEVTIAGRSQEKLIQAQRELGGGHTAVMEITDEGTVEKVFAALSQVDHVLISAGTIVNGAIVKNGLTNLRRIVDERLWGLTSVVRHAAPGWPRGRSPSPPGVCRRVPVPGPRC
jgi:NADP-dependent 3-hydroxy acid dehydrogenase YdfG